MENKDIDNYENNLEKLKKTNKYFFSFVVLSASSILLIKRKFQLTNITLLNIFSCMNTPFILYLLFIKHQTYAVFKDLEKKYSPKTLKFLQTGNIFDLNKDFMVCKRFYSVSMVEFRKQIANQNV